MESTPKIFMSYSHDSPEHSERVLHFAWSLRRNGIDVELDQFHNEKIVDWPRWCNDRIGPESCDFVLCVCTAEYKRRIEGNVPPEKGKGVYWEGSLLDDVIYDDKGNRRIIPVLFDSEPESSIPRFLRGWTHCRTIEFVLNDAGYEHLIRILTGQAKTEKNELGTVPVLPTRRAPVNALTATGTEFKSDISRIVKYAPTELIGREAETALLNDAWARVQSQAAKRPHILTFVALGGEGKTSLVAKWVADLAYQNWPGCDAVFAWSFYSQGTRDQVAASSDLFLKEALNFFGDDDDKEFAASNAGAFERGQRLARIVGQRRALLILDGLEPLQYAPTSPTPGKLKDQGIAALLKGLAANSHGLCVVTTRYEIPDLRAFIGKNVLKVMLSRLSNPSGVELLHSLGVKGTSPELERLVENLKGHALTLNLFGAYLRTAHAGDVREAWRVSVIELDRPYDTFTVSARMVFCQRLAASIGVSGKAVKVLEVRRGSCIVVLEFESEDAFVQFVAAATLGDERLSDFRHEWNVKEMRMVANIVDSKKTKQLELNSNQPSVVSENTQFDSHHSNTKIVLATAKSQGTATMNYASHKASDLKGKIHVAIITIRQDEYEAVEARLGDSTAVEGGNISYEHAIIQAEQGELISVVLTRCVGQGNLSALAVANNIIFDLDPSWLFLVGIAGGVPDNEYSLGDVVIASSLHDFSFGASNSTSHRSYQSGGGHMHQEVENFLRTKIVGKNRRRLIDLAGFMTQDQFLRHPGVFAEYLDESTAFYGDDDFKNEVKRKLAKRFPNGKRNGSPVIWAGPCANGNLLVKDPELLKVWQESARQVVQIETELAGVYEAARSAGRQNYPVLAIRGLSDVVGLKRDSDWTPYACETAAAMACAILRSGFIDFSKNLPNPN